MNEIPPKNPENNVSELELRKQELITLANELWQNGETFPFSGVDEVSYAKMKTCEGEDEGFTMPIDDIILQLENQGMKVVVSSRGNIHILPAGSNSNINDSILPDSILPRHLKVTEGMNEQLKTLILESNFLNDFYISAKRQ